MAFNPNASPWNISSDDRVDDLTKKDIGLLSSFDVGGLDTVTFRNDAQPDEPAGIDLSIVPYPEDDAHDSNSWSRGESDAWGAPSEDARFLLIRLLQLKLVNGWIVNASDFFWRKSNAAAVAVIKGDS